MVALKTDIFIERVTENTFRDYSENVCIAIVSRPNPSSVRQNVAHLPDAMSRFSNNFYVIITHPLTIRNDSCDSVVSVHHPLRIWSRDTFSSSCYKHRIRDAVPTRRRRRRL